MAEEIIEITFNPDTTVEVRTKGMPGKACLDRSSFIEKILGKVVGVTKTAEYFQKPAHKEMRATTR